MHPSDDTLDPDDLEGLDDPPEAVDDTFGALLAEVAAAEPVAPGEGPAPGDVLDGRYELLHELGRGGFGVVFRARQRSTGQDVAVKLLHRALSGRGRVLERFEREKDTLSRLRHPHIVPLLDWGELETGELFMVLAFIEGEALSAVLERGPLPREEALRLMGEVLDALCAAHEAGVIHRDLKPANIILTTSGAVRHATVLDFGIAALTAPRGAHPAEPITGEDAPGTPWYMSPEQLKGERSPAVDLYAWGLVLLECLTGERAVPELSPLRAHAWQLSDAPIELPEGLEGSRLGELIRHATHKDVSQRAQSARELLDALRRGDDETAPAPTRSAHQTIALVLLVAGLIVAGALLLIPAEPRQAVRPTDPLPADTEATAGSLLEGAVLGAARGSSPPARSTPLRRRRVPSEEVSLGVTSDALSELRASHGPALRYDLQFETGVLTHQRWRRPALDVTPLIDAEAWSRADTVGLTDPACEGPAPEAPGAGPRTQLTPREAEGFCRAHGMRLPTSREWEALGEPGVFGEWVRCGADGLRNCREGHAVRGARLEGGSDATRRHLLSPPPSEGCPRSPRIGFRCVQM